MDHITGMYFLCNTTREIRSSAVKWENKILERGLDFSAIVIYLGYSYAQGKKSSWIKVNCKKKKIEKKKLYIWEKHEENNSGCSQVNNLQV